MLFSHAFLIGLTKHVTYVIKTRNSIKINVNLINLIGRIYSNPIKKKTFFNDILKSVITSNALNLW
jgi:transposase